ncbi:MAG: lytic transglycosylase domain-containing protein [Spirochaetes bacterium]|nr:lytic transglycosylase domain-containing protein [Spirochaetota bacterium]
MSKKMLLLKFVLFYSIFLFPFVDNLYSEIEKRILKDGTIEYYNSEEITASPEKIKFESPYNELIESISGKYGLDPYLVKCIIKVESDFKADAVSVAGAMGLMQIMQHIARAYEVKNPLDPEENLSAGIRHLKFLLDYFKNDKVLAVAAYHAGLGRVSKKMNVPSIQSTMDYVNDVMYLYSGKKVRNDEKISALYQRINSEGTLEIYNK